MPYRNAFGTLEPVDNPRVDHGNIARNSERPEEIQRDPKKLSVTPRDQETWTLASLPKFILLAAHMAPAIS